MERWQGQPTQAVKVGEALWNGELLAAGADGAAFQRIPLSAVGEQCRFR